MKKLTNWLARNSLWCIGILLMLASSGLDGAYMARWQPEQMAWLGYVLNTVADCGGMLLSYWYGRLQMDRSVVKRRRSRVLLIGEGIAIAYSWFFSWRQLLIVLPAIEGGATAWVAPVTAGFVPLLLAAIGYTQALLAGRIESATAVSTATLVPEPVALDLSIAEHSDNGKAHFCPYCDAEFGSTQAVSAHLRFCEAYQTQKAQPAQMVNAMSEAYS
jgi:hypothetical protein